MYVGENDARKLVELGFKRTFYVDEVAPFDIYKHNEEEWCVGGRIVPEGNLLSPNEVYLNGAWLPNIYDLMFWLESNDYMYVLSHNYEGLLYKLEVFDEDRKVLVKAKGGTPANVFCNAILKILAMKRK
ncbi:hypothetical protein ACFP56_08955 [Paenibacillus septentrionalis]|uniref:Phage ABA sandwich domain-containing protein n=1 Tax=Paenibacillus septentrionalis TaxID=429342 RepID=A0ABW1V5V7_9BACL